jgi:hypothetical protein
VTARRRKLAATGPGFLEERVLPYATEGAPVPPDTLELVVAQLDEPQFHQSIQLDLAGVT